MKFVHLHVHSHYSLLDGLATPEQLVKRAAELGFEALAITDHGVLYGAIEFYQKAKKAGIKPIIGCELYVAYEGMSDKRPGLDDKRYHLTVLARDYAGYQNLIKLVTQSHLVGFYYKPRVDKALLREHAQGLIALSGCLTGEIPQAIRTGKLDRAEAIAREYQDIFGVENFYLELGAHPNIPEQAIVNSALLELSKKTGAKVVGVNDVHYARRDDQNAQDILVSIQTGSRIEDGERLSMKADDFSLKSLQDMAEFFKDTPEAITNTWEIAERINLEIPLGQNLFPQFNVPDGYTAQTYLEKLTGENLERRYGAVVKNPEDPAAKTIFERLRYELDVIAKTGFSSYFLIVHDFMAWARSQKIVVGPGRGSGPSSIVAYLLGITNIDPLAYNLIFERFLNPERIAPPDFDLDFSDRRRDEVIEYVSQKYGRDRVAQIITFGTMAARAAIRDTGRALGMPYGFCDAAAKMIPFHMTLKESLEKVPEFKEFYNSRDDAKKLIDNAMKLEGVARHASTHACGVVIAPGPLTDYVPLQLATRSGARLASQGEAAKSGAKNGNGEEVSKVVVTQYEMHAIEDLGLLKMDFLGLRNLTIIEDAVQLIKDRHAIDLDIDTIPLDDRETIRIFRAAKTNGVFQFESAGMKRYLKELKPTELEDLISMTSLFRPGPMDLIPSFILRKNGQERVTYLHPKLEPILKNTYGIGVYQEQMMQIARDLAGYTLPEADTLRKAIGKKIKSLLDQQREKLIAGMLANGIQLRVAEQIWELFPPFARYGFNRSHAACYALIAYQTAYLKAHWPAEFMAALMTSDGSDIERIGFLVDEARSMGMSILPPSVNSSNATFTVVSEKEIRFGLGSVKNVGSNIVEAIITARENKGPFTSISDFVERVAEKDLNKKSFEALAKCGAFDELGERNQILANMEKILDYARTLQKQQSMGQPSLFGGSDSATSSGIRLEPAAPRNKKEQLGWEKELLGLYISEHPLDDYRAKFANKVTPLSQLVAQPKDAEVRIGGLVSSMKKIMTKAGSPMLFVTFEDLTGKAEILVFPRVLEKSVAMWQPDKILMIKGRVSRDRDEPKVLAEEVVEVV